VPLAARSRLLLPPYRSDPRNRRLRRRTRWSRRSRDSESSPRRCRRRGRSCTRHASAGLATNCGSDRRAGGARGCVARRGRGRRLRRRSSTRRRRAIASPAPPIREIQTKPRARAIRPDASSSRRAFHRAPRGGRSDSEGSCSCQRTSNARTARPGRATPARHRPSRGRRAPADTRPEAPARTRFQPPRRLGSDPQFLSGCTPVFQLGSDPNSLVMVRGR